MKKTVHSKRTRNAASFIIVCAAAGGGMRGNMLKVLAVEDPAVMVYVDKKLNLLNKYGAPVQFDVVPWDSYYPKMIESFAGKADYDIIMVAGHLWKRDFVENDYLEELEYEQEDILPEIMQEMMWNGKTYLSPSFCDGHMVVYRKSVVKEAMGKELPMSITAEEYIGIAKTIFENTGKPAIAMKAAESEIFTDALPFLRMYGQDVYQENGVEVNCDQKAVIDGLEQYCKLRAYACEETENFGNAEIADAIKKKKIPMTITWSGQLGTLLDEECIEKEGLGFTTLQTAWNVTWSFAVCKQSKNKEDAKEFLNYLRMPMIDELAGRFSGAPVREQNYRKGSKEFPWYDCQMQMIKSAKGLLDVRAAGKKNAVFYREIYNAFEGIKTPERAMKEAKIEIDKIMD